MGERELKRGRPLAVVCSREPRREDVLRAVVDPLRQLAQDLHAEDDEDGLD